MKRRRIIESPEDESAPEALIGTEITDPSQFLFSSVKNP